MCLCLLNLVLFKAYAMHFIIRGYAFFCFSGIINRSQTILKTCLKRKKVASQQSMLLPSIFSCIAVLLRVLACVGHSLSLTEESLLPPAWPHSQLNNAQRCACLCMTTSLQRKTRRQGRKKFDKRAADGRVGFAQQDVWRGWMSLSETAVRLVVSDGGN